VTKAGHSYTLEMADRMYGPQAAGVQDGEYLDSIEGWAQWLDYRPESLRYATLPLSFDTDTRQAALPTWFSVWEFARFVRADLLRRGKLLMANGTPWRFHAFAPLLDVLGTETNWLPGGRWAPDTDAVFNLRRTLSAQKPYLLLQNADFDAFGPYVERYFQRSMFYGVYPSFFSIDASTHPYWTKPAWYNRDRPLFKKYIPVVRRLSAAGWEPITGARSSQPAVGVERFGQEYLTVLNDSRERATATIAVERPAFGLERSGAPVTVTDAVEGGAVAVEAQGASVTIRLSLGPEEARALHLRAGP
jgi:hypothetical protein